jgi:hypothetical protein
LNHVVFEWNLGMKRHGAREQKRLAKKKAKEAERRKELARRSSDNPLVRLRAADRWPVHEALVPDNLWSTGIGTVVIARRAPGGMIAYGSFLVDVFCLGIKDAFWRIMSAAEYRSLLEKVAECGALERVSPEHVSKLVHCAADYAQSLGFAPHPDFRHVRLLLEGVDPSLCSDEFQFGQDGKPFYVRGPYESIGQARIIAERISQRGGHYLVPVDPQAFVSEDVAELSDEELGDDEFKAFDEPPRLP